MAIGALMAIIAALMAIIAVLMAIASRPAAQSCRRGNETSARLERAGPTTGV